MSLRDLLGPKPWSDESHLGSQACLFLPAAPSPPDRLPTHSGPGGTGRKNQFKVDTAPGPSASEGQSRGGLASPGLESESALSGGTGQSLPQMTSVLSPLLEHGPAPHVPRGGGPLSLLLFINRQ